MGVLVGSGVAVGNSVGVGVSAGGSGGSGVVQLYSKQQPWQAKPSWEIPSAEQETNLPMEKDHPEQGLGSHDEQEQPALGLAKARKVHGEPRLNQKAIKSPASSTMLASGTRRNFNQVPLLRTTRTRRMVAVVRTMKAATIIGCFSSGAWNQLLSDHSPARFPKTVKNEMRISLRRTFEPTYLADVLKGRIKKHHCPGR